MEYIAYLHKDRKSDCGVSFPDFPGCVTAGRTLEEARQKAIEALTFHMRGMAEDGAAAPPPSTIDEIADDPAAKHAVMFLVPIISSRLAEKARCLSYRILCAKHLPPRGTGCRRNARTRRH